MHLLVSIHTSSALVARQHATITMIIISALLLAATSYYDSDSYSLRYASKICILVYYGPTLLSLYLVLVLLVLVASVFKSRSQHYVYTACS